MRACGIWIGLLAAIASAQSKPEPKPVPLKDVPLDGKSHHVVAKGATYYVAIPPGIDENKPTRVLLWLHGSNMSGINYTESLKELGFGKNEIIAGPNGDGRVRDWVYNFTYDPKPALKTLDDLAKRFKLGKVYVGGHSQGAYYTFLLVTKFPERFAGGIPFAGGLLKGCDPKTAANRKGMPGPAVAIIHGEADPVVPPSLSDWAYEIFLDADWPRLRYYHPDKLNHWFLPGPVKPALEWCFAVTSDDPAELIASAEKYLKENRGNDALYCLERARTKRGDGAKIKALRKQVDEKAAELAGAWLKRMKNEKNGTWWPEIYDWRQNWGQVRASAAVMKQLKNLRKRHKSAASKLSRKAWKFDGKGDRDKARDHFRKIVSDCPTAFEYVRPAKRWLAKHPG